MADKNIIFNNLAEGIALGTTELCDILRYSDCDLAVEAKEALITELAAEKNKDAKIPAQERRKVFVKSIICKSEVGQECTHTFSNTGNNLVSFSVAFVKRNDEGAAVPTITHGVAPDNLYTFTDKGEVISVEAPDGGYLSGGLTITLPITAADDDNVLALVYTYEEI